MDSNRRMDLEERSYVNWLYHVPGLGRKKMNAVLAGGATPAELYKMQEKQLCNYMQTKCGLTERAAQTAAGSVATLRRLKTPAQLMEEIYQKHIIFLLSEDPEYPEKLKDIPDAPFALYMKGSKEAAGYMSQHSVAIIGARECSEYGKYVAGLLGYRCGQMGLPVVSGMAHGVDGLAQWAAVREGAPVAAILGSGVDVCYPYSNRKLYDALAESGCIYSEYIPGTEPKPTNFPPRNRIISGMADALIVVEAKERSGTLITVDMALEQGKEVYAIPGRINDPMSRGCNRLVRQGASIVCDVDEVLEEIACRSLHNTSKIQETEAENPYPPEHLRHVIYRALDMQPKSVQQIYEALMRGRTGDGWNLSIAALQTELFYMQMEGTVRESCGRFGIGNSHFRQ